jgi:porin
MATPRYAAGCAITATTAPVAAVLLGLAVAMPRPAAAQAVGTPAAATPAATPAPTGLAALFSDQRTNLLGDMAGLRTSLGNVGISLGLTETSEVLGNVTGGVHQGAAYEGLTEMSLGLDTGRAFGWKGGTFNVSALQIHGRDLSTDNLETLQTASGIEANRATRLWELWYDQAFPGGMVDVKVGQQSIDQEFMVSQYSGFFINTAMGFPVLPSSDLYAGGPSYPLSSLGIRLRVQPLPTVTVLAGVFDDNPPGGPFNDDSQLRGAEKSGLRFNLNTGALFIAELQYQLNPAPSGDPSADQKSPPSGLPGTYKIGFWYDTGAFPDQRFDNMGLSLASPASTGIPLLHQHNESIYGLVDQTVWQPDPKAARALSVFARAMGAPPDRNLISFSFDAGLNLKAPLPGRDNDTFGIGYGLAQVSRQASELDKDEIFFTGGFVPVRGSESFIEVTYQAQLAPWWQVQPDFQYVFTPGGGLANPNEPGKRIGNEAVLGLRTTVTF